MDSKDGRHPMPSKEKLASVFQELGLRYEDQIVVYDQGAAPFAPRAWWMLTYAGFPNVVIVNGGALRLRRKFLLPRILLNIHQPSLSLIGKMSFTHHAKP